MDLELEGKTAIVTGGSLGIGKAVALELAKEGVDVAICARRRELLEEAAAELQAQTGRRILPVPADTTKRAEVENMVSTAASTLGKVDILVNNAAVIGGLVQGPLDEATEELLSRDLDTKVVGYFRCAKAVAPLMMHQNWGRIINIGGTSGRYGGVISGMRNAAVAHLTKSLSEQLGPHGITVNAIHPGTIRTERTGPDLKQEASNLGITSEEVEQRLSEGISIRRIIDAREIGFLACFLASPKAAAITGDVMGIDGGEGAAVFY